jgi:preprotein translocase subunit SecG
MSAVVLVIHMILAIAIIGLVLLQRSEGGGLGIGGSGGMGGIATPQGAASAMTRATWWCVAGFFVTSLTLGVMSGQGGSSIMDKLDEPVAAAAAPATTPDVPAGGTASEDAAAKPAEAAAPAAAPEAPVAE